MSWRRRGVQLLLQVRVRILNEELQEKFNTWYPGCVWNNDEPARSSLPFFGLNSFCAFQLAGNLIYNAARPDTDISLYL